VDYDSVCEPNSRRHIRTASQEILEEKNTFLNQLTKIQSQTQ